MAIVWIFLLFGFTVVAWVLGFKSSFQKNKQNIPRDYLIGLNCLLNDETDKAVEIFIKMLELDSKTVETHFAVAKLFRKRGEIDSAIRIHQNLIARPQMDKFYREQAMYELGEDYKSIGLLDRAEQILTRLIKNTSHTKQALKTLLDLYQQAKDWQQAINTAEQLELVTKENMQPVIAQYYCELADIAYMRQQNDTAHDLLLRALRCDKSCVRASILQAKVFISQEDYKHSIRSLKKIKKQNPNFLSESIDLLACCYEKIGTEEKLVQYLKKIVDEHPEVPVVLILAERIRQHKGEKVALKFVAGYVRQYPSLYGLSILIDLYLATVEGSVKDDLVIVQNLMKKLLSSKPEYLCHSCGFSGKTLHWQCPGCRHWNSILPVHVTEAAEAV